ncbi:hypothetical protein BDR04DRAFT_1098618 [Suillus decipiens]|nr:hypothetical protein BDR04DRAFT_1098618 [Suillus decipiens]
MQFCGLRFRSVICSMWPVDDEAACQSVPAFYRNLIDELGRLNGTRWHCTRL